MGYSIFVKAKSKKIQQQMRKFIHDNMVSYSKHFYNSDGGDYYALRAGSQDTELALSISYLGVMREDPDVDLTIGFDYNASSGEREYVFRVLKWMAKKIGKNPNIYYYDGEETEITDVSIRDLISNESDRMNKDSVKSKAFNFMCAMRAYLGYGINNKKEGEKIINFIEGEIARLDELWLKTISK